MRTPIKLIALTISILFGASGAAVSAQQPVTLEGAAYLMKREIDDQGKPVVKLIKPDVVVPGDRILFATKYENVSASAVTNFVVINPVPASVQLAFDADPDLIVSVDGGSSWGVLRELSVADGMGSTHRAKPSDVTHLRWVIPTIAPNEAGRLEYIASVR